MNTNNRPVLSLNVSTRVQNAIRKLVHAKMVLPASKQARRIDQAQEHLQDELRWAAAKEATDRLLRESAEANARYERAEAEARIKEADERRIEAEAEERRIAAVWERLEVHFYYAGDGELAFLPSQGGCGVGWVSEWSRFGAYDHIDEPSHASRRNQGRKPRKPWYRRRSPDKPWPV